MKLLFDATVLEYPPTGVAKVTLGLYAASQKLDPTLEIIAVHRRGLYAPLPPGIRSLQGKAFWPPALWRQIYLPAETIRHRGNVIHFPWNGYVPLLVRLPTIVTTLHDVLPLTIPGFFPDSATESQYRKERQTDILRTDLLLTDSEFSKQEILRNFLVDREPVVVPFGPTLSASSRSPRPAGHDGYFLYVGGYNPRKGLQELLKAFLELRREQKLHSKLILTGSKLHVSDTFPRLVEDGVRMGAVEERGYVSDDVLASLYTNAIALVYPSKYEGFGLPPLEAMALGCPVLTTSCTSLPEICGDAAYYIDPDNSQSIAQGLIDLESKPDLRMQYSARGKEQSTRFTWDRAATTFLNALNETMRHWNVSAGTIV